MPTRTKRPRPLTEKHKRAVAAVESLFRLCPKEAATWLYSRRRRTSILAASFLEQAPKGPAYAVPASRPAPAPPATAEEVVKRVITDVIERDAAASSGEPRVEVVQFDFEEARRQAIVKGGCEVELLLRAKVGRGKPFEALVGIALPDEHDDGSEMHWHMLEKSTWHMLASDKLAMARDRSPERQRIVFELVPLYLWPGTGLKDVQEDCSVLTGTLEMPGFLGDIMRLAASDGRGRERDRELNKERLEFHRGLDLARREAAARRLARTGDAGITDEELAALVPAIDLDQDRVTMRLSYEIVRLWEEPVEALIEALPPECVGLSLFGQRPPGVTTADVLRQSAWALRRGLRGAGAARVERATAALGAVAAAHLDPVEVRRMLASMKL